MTARRAQLVAQAVAVLCPYCGEPQPSPDGGSDLWTHDDFAKRKGVRPDDTTCVSCDRRIQVLLDHRVDFR